VPRLLIVDDDPQFRRTLHLALDSHGYEVGDAADGKQALDRVAAKAPDLIVLDWHLPDMDGIQTCRELRAHSDVPVIMVSANRSNSKDLALDAGANDYLPKPFSVDELLQRIESVLKR
jgi:DNA-binding response OmpR family regulator